MDLQKVLSEISPPDAEAIRAAVRCRWNRCAKPLGGLGMLEMAIEKIAILKGKSVFSLDEKAAFVFCADNGVVAQSVTQTDSDITGIVARKMAQGWTCVCQMARVARCRIATVDIGIRNFDPFPGVIRLRVGNGTEDFTTGAAMTRHQVEEAVLTGIRLVEAEYKRGTDLLVAGEMGIGNTTTASAVVSVLLNCPAEEVTGRGAGLSDEGLIRKIQVIRQGIAVNHPDPDDPLDVLRKVGGFDLAGMCGMFLGGALYRIPVLIDGFPSAVAALCALRLCSSSRHAMLASHLSAEPGAQIVLEALGKQPILTARMHLGEGSGAVAIMPLLDMALAVYRNAYTFEEGGIPAYQPLGEGGVFQREQKS